MLNSENILGDTKYEIVDSEDKNLIYSINSTTFTYREPLNSELDMNVFNYFEEDSSGSSESLKISSKIKTSKIGENFAGALYVSDLNTLYKDTFEIKMSDINPVEYYTSGKRFRHSDEPEKSIEGFLLNVDALWQSRTAQDDNGNITRGYSLDERITRFGVYRAPKSNPDDTWSVSGDDRLFAYDNDINDKYELTADHLDGKLVLCYGDSSSADSKDYFTPNSIYTDFTIKANSNFALYLLKKTELKDNTIGLVAYKWGFMCNGILYWFKSDINSNSNNFYLGESAKYGRVLIGCVSDYINDSGAQQAEYVLLSTPNSMYGLYGAAESSPAGQESKPVISFKFSYGPMPLKWKNLYYYEYSPDLDSKINTQLIPSQSNSSKIFNSTSVIKYQVNYSIVNASNYINNDESADGSFILKDGLLYVDEDSEYNEVLSNNSVFKIRGYNKDGYNDDSYYFRYLDDNIADGLAGEFKLINPIYNYFEAKNFSAIIMGNIFKPLFDDGYPYYSDTTKLDRAKNIYKYVGIKYMVGTLGRGSVVDSNSTEDYEYGISSSSTEGLSILDNSHFKPGTLFNVIETADASNPLYIMSDMEVHSTGGENQIISKMEANGSEVFPSFYKFRKLHTSNYTNQSSDVEDDITKGSYTYSVSYDVSNIYVEIFDMKPKKTGEFCAVVDLSCRLPKGNYIIPVYNIVANGDRNTCEFGLANEVDGVKLSLFGNGGISTYDDRSRVRYYNLEISKDYNDTLIPLRLV
jgi:hypothetical protein